MALQDDLARAERRQHGIEDELAKERADALGRTGRRLEDALHDYRAALDAASGALDAEHAEVHLRRIADRVYALVVQREAAGARADGLGWLRAAYDIPEAALKRIGIRRPGVPPSPALSSAPAPAAPSAPSSAPRSVPPTRAVPGA